MNRELENNLVATYPTIYQALTPRFSGSCLFQCDDGWYAIIDQLSCRLEAQARRSLLLVLEVKEKLGGLRVRMRGNVTDDVDGWLISATNLSQRTCERCGHPARLRGHMDGRVRTLCLKCATAMHYLLE
ncbi:hypothetical protein KDX27_07590 [Burkholderia cenocepacia]|jgi:ribosomal protein S27AE|uniref:Uncharacterized protein n=1 Tax=Burkholderia cenocepacia TaxID=95486 RepID=A0ABD4U8H2_9BURK|nr:hypothetical protein [Burkholderia cenocepacia]AIO44934.1 hypothetical protein DM42_4683 [Burkholderia cepacia]KGC01029.1 hypothetical protein DM44_5458 [Burkholderia cepacia]MBJ9697785.1 hypothetical protein [Burkholderia cenocepacia]MBN3530370.1 hypothetical protein [Burkholderia cenocepacia]MBO1855770.1 hypothetical protein [Burkholderia cenocepacia]